MGLKNKNEIIKLAQEVANLIDQPKDGKMVNDIADKVEAMVTKEENRKEAPSTALEDFSNLYFDVLKTHVLPYAVKLSNRQPYGEYYEDIMNKMFNALPEGFKSAIGKEIPVDNEEYKNTVTEAFDAEYHKLTGYSDTHYMNEKDPDYVSYLALKDASQNALIGTNYSSKEDAKSKIGVLASKYVDAKTHYHNLTFFKKYFTFKGYKMRSAMSNARDVAKSVNEVHHLTQNPDMNNFLEIVAFNVDMGASAVEASYNAFNKKRITIEDEEVEAGVAEEKEKMNDTQPVTDTVMTK